jgi:ferrous iron transport protein B
MTIVLAGNPNSGKTTLFNELTGTSQHTGNYPGVTVDIKEGDLRLPGRKIRIVDLPGIYSLDPDTAEQKLARDYLEQNPVDLIINVVDAGNLERSLFLSIQLIKTNRPILMALNMMDEVEKKGGRIDTQKLQFLLGIHTVPVSAAKHRVADLQKHIDDVLGKLIEDRILDNP